MKKGKLSCLITIIIVYFLYEYFLAYDCKRAYYCFISEPEDIELPVVKEAIKFNREGYEREYIIKPKYRGMYRIRIILENYNVLGEKIEKCKGEIEILYFSQKRLVKKKIIKKFHCYLFSWEKWCSLIYLDEFDYYNSIFRRDIDRIVIKVNKPLKCFPKGENKKTYLVIKYYCHF